MAIDLDKFIFNSDNLPYTLYGVYSGTFSPSGTLTTGKSTTVNGTTITTGVSESIAVILWELPVSDKWLNIKQIGQAGGNWVKNQYMIYKTAEGGMSPIGIYAYVYIQNNSGTIVPKINIFNSDSSSRSIPTDSIKYKVYVYITPDIG